MEISPKNASLKNINMQKFYDYAYKIMPVKNDDLVFIYFSHLTKNHRDVLTAYYGLDGSTRCTSIEKLVKKLNNPNAAILLKEAKKAFKDQPYIDMLIDNQNFFPSLATALGKIGAQVYFGSKNKYQCVQNIFSGIMINNLIETSLSKRQKEILKMRYGLDGSEPKKIKEIAEILNLKPKSVNTYLFNGLNKLGLSVDIFVIK